MRLIAVMGLTAIPTGCMLGRQHPAATQPATAIDVKQSRPAYWLDQPAVARITAKSFDALWSACRDAARDDGFTIDRTDSREGLLTTLPLVSKQFYEFWRNDTVDPHSLLQSSLGTFRRTVWFSVRRLDDGSFEATPKVLVEQDALLERRITSVDQYQNIFAVQAVDVSRQTERTGDLIPGEYWFSIGRDPALEKQLAASVRSRLHGG